MNQDARGIVLLSLVLAVVFTVLAIAGRNEKLPRNAFYGIRTNMTLRTEETWIAAHQAAAPFNFAASLCFGLTAIAAAFFADTARGASVALIIGGGAGMIAVGATIYVARRAAVKVLGG